MNEIKITVNAQEITNALNAIAEILKEVVKGMQLNTTGGATVSQMQQATPAPTAPAPTPAPTPAPAPAPTAPAPTPAPAPVVAQAGEITLDMLSRAGAELIDRGLMNQVMALINQKYNVITITQLPKEQYQNLAADLRALGASI